MDKKRLSRKEKARRKKMQEACRKMDELGKKFGKWDATVIIRKFWDTNLKGAYLSPGTRL